METVHTLYLGNLRTEATHVKSGEKLITDAPADNNGKGEFFSPSDLLATALGCCMLNVMGHTANVYGFTIDGATVKTTKIMGANPRRVVEIVVEITFPHDNYSDKERKLLQLAAKECPVANSLHLDLKQTVSFLFKK